VQVAAEHSAADVIVNGVDAGPPGTEGTPRPGTEPKAADPDRVAAALGSQPGTAHWLGYAETDVVVPGLTGESSLVQYTENPGWVGYELVSGRWFTRPGEAVVPTELLRATDREIGDTVTLTRKGESLTLTIVGEVFDPGDDDGLVLTLADAGTTLTTWLVGVSDSTDPGKYAEALQQDLDALGLTAHVDDPDGPDELVIVIDALAGLLTLMLVTVAGLGILNAVVLDVRDRVHDIGIHKALGMTPRQTLTAVLSSVVAIGLVGGLVGVPAGVVLHGILLPAMAHGAGVELPTVVLTVYEPVLLTTFVLGGLVLAVAGALLPAGWAARTRTATALRTE
jgi:putative ABC transport system permease protein